MASASLVSRSSPSSMTRPEATCPGGETSRMMDSAVTVFPQPLSPTSPSTSPRWMVKLTPSTARRTPCPVGKCVCRSSTARRATSDLQARIEGVAEPVAEQVDGQHGQHDGQSRKGGEPPGGGDVVSPIGEHPAPGGRGWLDAEPEEGERRLVDDHEGQLQGGHHDDGRQGVGEHVAQEQPKRSIATRPSPAHELPLADGKHVGAYDTRELYPARDGHDQDDIEEAGAEGKDNAH